MRLQKCGHKNCDIEKFNRKLKTAGRMVALRRGVTLGHAIKVITHDLPQKAFR